MRVLEEVRVKVDHANRACNLNLILEADMCVDNHSVWVIRPDGAETGGLVIVHLDDTFTPEDVIVLVEMLTPAFFAEMNRLKYLTTETWSYLDGVFNLGMELIQVMGSQIPGGKRYWSHDLQCMLDLV